jgi:16S rRNA (cytosine1402-N4)-methyltransferase
MRRPYPPRSRSTPAGEHRAVLLDEVLVALELRPGMVVVDCTLGWAGHSAELLKRILPDGKLLGLDLDAANLERARERLTPLGESFALHHSNFAGIQNVLGVEGLDGADAILADLGMSSMQVDDTERGFSYSRDGPLDMRMDRSRGKTAAQVLAAISEKDLAEALHELGDEPEAARVARAIVTAREKQPIERTTELSRILLEASAGERKGGQWQLHPSRGKWNLHPAARTFQVLRILTNRELANLEQLLRVLPDCLRPGGTAAIISFHSGEDRRVKAAFREGKHTGLYAGISEEPVRPTFEERNVNPRSRSAKMRWARRAPRPGCGNNAE